MKRYTDESEEVSYGLPHETYAELDLHQLKMINKRLKMQKKIAYIDPESLIATFGGHTIFSIYNDQIQVFDSIYE